jgi:hypothetical protein
VNRATWSWAAILIPLGIALGICAYWEPVLRDGWGHLHWFREGGKLDAGSIYELVVGAWRYENPRLGQTFTTIVYGSGPIHVVSVIVLGLGMFTLLTTMVLGRRPSLRRTDDAIAFVTVTALVLCCVPKVGAMLFYRPFLGNYTFGLVLQLLWLVPYRLHLVEARPWRAWWSPLLLVLGVAAGMCNEHAGPAFIAAGAAVVGYGVARGDRIKPWMVAGLVGLVLGYALLMFAPGQSARYGGLAQQAGPIERVIERGVIDNLRVLGALGQNLLWTLPWLALGVVARQATPPAPLPRATRLAILGLATMGVLIGLVLLGSPKLGPRLYLHSVALLACAAATWLHAQLVDVRLRRVTSALSCVVIAYVAIRCVAVYRVVGPIGRARVAAIRFGPPGAKVVVPRYPVGAGHYFLGEDFTADNLRAALAQDYGLASIDLGD